MTELPPLKDYSHCLHVNFVFFVKLSLPLNNSAKGFFYDTGQKVDVIINFECDRNIDFGSPAFLRKEQTAYVFTFKTALACSPASVDCLVQDKAGNQYDLRTLYRPSGWNAYDPSKQNTYYINVCRAINNMTSAHCPGKPISLGVIFTVNIGIS